jgi:hypothetical protein
MRRVGSPSVWRLAWGQHRAPAVQRQLLKPPWLALWWKMEMSLWLALKGKMKSYLWLAQGGSHPQC